MTYDVHGHIVPRSLLDLLRRDGPRLGVTVESAGESEVVILDTTRPAPIRQELLDLPKRIEWMDRSGIDIQLLSGWIDLTGYGLAPSSAATYSRICNESLAAEVAGRPDRFLALATVPLQDPPAAADELLYAVKDLAMPGVQIATTVVGTELDRAGLDPFWEAAEALRCLVLLHPYRPLAGLDLSDHFLDNLIGRPAESTVAIARLMLSGLFDRYPHLKICVVHGGGFLPFQLGRIERGYRAVPQRVAKDSQLSPTEIAALLYYDTVLHSPAAVGSLVRLVGAERILLGSDYPFEMGDPDPVRTVEAAGLTAGDRARITTENALTLLAGVRR